MLFSTVLTEYLAQRTIHSSWETDLGLEDSNMGNVPFKDKQELKIKRVCKKKVCLISLMIVW